MTKFDLTKEDLKDIPKERLDKAWEEYDKHAHMIETHNIIKTRRKSFLGGFVLGALFFTLLTVAVGGTLILLLLDK